MVGGVAFSGLGGNLFRGGGRADTPASTGSTADSVATVGDLTVTKAALDNIVQRRIEQESMYGQAPPTPSADQMEMYRAAVGLAAFKQYAAAIAAAKAVGDAVTDADVDQEREKVWAEQRPQLAAELSLPAAATDSQIDSALQTQGQGMSVAGYKASLPDYALRASAAQSKLQQYFSAQTPVDPASVKRSYDDIQVRHILVKSGAQGGLPDAQAKTKAQKLLALVLTDPSKMPELANENSDDPSNTDPKTHQKKGGFYDWTPASQYVPEFSQAALKAGVGKVYPEVVKSQFGYHIIKLEGERAGNGLPKDFDKNPQLYVAQYRDRIVQTKLQQAMQDATQSVPVNITDPLLQAAQLEIDADQAPDKRGRDAKLTEALANLDKVKPADDTVGTVPMQRAAIYTELGRSDDAIKALNDSLNYRNTPETRLRLATMYLTKKDIANAKLQVAEAQKLPIPTPDLERQIASMLRQVGDRPGAIAAGAKAAELQARQDALDQEQRETSARSSMHTAPIVVPPAAATKTSTAAASAAPATPAAASSTPVPAPAGAPAPAPAATAASGVPATPAAGG
jgi:parvulin-like peptidyl-prolyl isomerase